MGIELVRWGDRRNGGGGWLIEEGGVVGQRKGLGSYFELVSYFDSICILIEIIVFVLIIILF